MVTGYGGTDVLELVEIESPAPGEGQLLVDVTIAGVNFRDCYERQGAGYGGTPPFVTGAEGAGIVAEVGQGVSDVNVGDRVAWSHAPGSYAEQVLVDAASAIPLPTGVSDEIAAAVLLQGMTAHYLSHDVYPVQDGDSVLVHAGAGGVGLLLTQMVRSRGGRVISTVSTDEKADLARAAGANETIPYEGFRERVRELTGGEGVAAVYDGVGKTTFDASLASLAIRGTLALFGASSGPVPPFDPQRLNAAGSVFLTRPTLLHYTRTPDEFSWRAGELLDAISTGTLTVTVSNRYPLADAADAHRDLEGRKTVGSVVLVPEQRG
jgi:NADPH2:quinone reductase